MKRLPVIIKAYESLPRNPKYPLQEFRLRVVKYHNSTTLLDIREYITSEEFTGYSPKGVSLNREQLMYLAAQLHDILTCMKDDTSNPSQLKLPLITKANISEAGVIHQLEEDKNADNS